MSVGVTVWCLGSKKVRRVWVMGFDASQVESSGDGMVEGGGNCSLGRTEQGLQTMEKREPDKDIVR